jgi:uncharacterized protein (DUF58 family)
MAMKVELLYFEGCPNAIEYLSELTALLASAGLTGRPPVQLIRSAAARFQAARPSSDRR